MDAQLSTHIIQALAVKDCELVSQCNQETSKYGLTLTDKEITQLQVQRFEALKSSGRVEFGQGILRPLIMKFCDSQFIHKSNYAETLAALQEMFYYFKTESGDYLSDNELLTIMKSIFDGAAQGSLEYLNSMGLETICRAIKGCDVDEGDDEVYEDEEYGEEDEYDV
ncbi:MAG: hypothetical protein IJF40_03195 [Clostridia bacterium]|nr:hypothetical protein [Clostridia bacterium]